MPHLHLRAILTAGVSWVLINTSMGCSGGDSISSRVAVEGKVLVNRRPVKYALIEFFPDDPEGSHVSTVLEGGQFRLTQEQGLIPGPYSVAVTGYTPETLADLSEAQQQEILASRSLIPDSYQGEGALKITIEPEMTNQLTLELATKQKK